MSYIPPSILTIPGAELLERMRRHHWRAYFLALRVRNASKADYHRKLAQALEKAKKKRAS